jgi:hypothetical protein
MNMKTKRWGMLVLGLLVSCRGRSDAIAEANATAAKQAPAAPSDAAPAAAPASGALAMLDRMDKRTPVPLMPMMAHHQKQNMRDHLAAVQQIVMGVATKDFATVEKAAGRIGYSETMGQMCSHMGAGAPGFTDKALEFHRGADEIGVAAKKRDAEGVLTSLARTLSRCTGCHEEYKQHVVDEDDWSAAAGGAKAPQHPMH